MTAFRREQLIGSTAPRRGWIPDLVVGVIVGVLGLLELVVVRYGTTGIRGSQLSSTGAAPEWFAILLVLGVGTAVGLCRRAPGPALTLAWTIGLVQLIIQSPAMLIEIALAVVIFGTARWGRPITAIAGAISVPAVPLLGVALVRIGFFSRLADLTSSERLLQLVFQSGPSSWRLVIGIAAVAVLGLPWLAGLTARFVQRAAESRRSMALAEQDAFRARRELEQTQEIARLREQQTQLANDVHDVVGHSLAVILAQAESAQYLPDSDVSKVKGAMATVADSARSSLQDVRRVLSSDSDADISRTDGLDSLIGAISDTRPGIESTELGRPHPLPPELATVAYRVLQEMLTNVLKHGRRDRPVQIERRWDTEGDHLRIKIINVAQSATDDTASDSGGGQGLPSMNSRLESVGGRLDIAQRQSPEGAVFIATAWLPVRAAGR